MHLRVPGLDLRALGGTEPAVVLVEVMVLGEIQPREGVLGLRVGPLQGDDAGLVAGKRHHHHVHHELTHDRDLHVGREVLDAAVVGGIERAGRVVAGGVHLGGLLAR